MSFRKSADAIADFRATIVRILSCISNAHVQTSYHDAQSGVSVPLTINRGIPARLTAATPLSLAVILYYVVESAAQTWRVRTTAYFYALHDDRHEILAYHWHPETSPGTAFPHLHLEAGAQIGRVEMQRAHLPTGRITLEDVIEMMIRDFAVTPFVDDWPDILAKTRQTANTVRS